MLTFRSLCRRCRGCGRLLVVNVGGILHAHRWPMVLQCLHFARLSQTGAHKVVLLRDAIVVLMAPPQLILSKANANCNY